MKHQVGWREEVAKRASIRVWQVESDAVVPVETASDNREYAARTIRSQLNEAADNFLKDLDTTAIEKDSTNLPMNGEDLSDLAALLEKLSVDRSVERVAEFVGGTSRAKAHLRQFIESRLTTERMMWVAAVPQRPAADTQPLHRNESRGRGAFRRIRVLTAHVESRSDPRQLPRSQIMTYTTLMLTNAAIVAVYVLLLWVASLA